MPGDVDYNKVKECFSACGKVHYVELKDGADDTKCALVRFAESESATSAAAVEEVDGTAVKVTALEGEVEKDFWARLHAAQANKFQLQARHAPRPS